MLGVAEVCAFRVLGSNAADEWDLWVQAVPLADAYYLHGYVSLAEVLGEGEIRLAVLDEPVGRVIYPFVLRRIAELPFATDLPDTAQCYDILSPYGYGGPLLSVNFRAENGDTARDLASRFRQRFGSWCRDNNVVSEFVRYHPLAANAGVFGSIDGATRDRETVYIGLSQGNEGVWAGLNRGSRGNVNRARRNGLVVTATPGDQLESTDLFRFVNLYEQTMDRNQASDYYYFGHAYFEALFRRLGSRAVLFTVHHEDEMIAGAVMLAYGRWLHYHLGASETASLSLRPNDLLFFEAATWGVDNGFQALHLGGGRTSKTDDSLLCFKASFSPLRAQFWTAGIVHLPNLYGELEQAWTRHTGLVPSHTYFPSYRRSI